MGDFIPVSNESQKALCDRMAETASHGIIKEACKVVPEKEAYAPITAPQDEASLSLTGALLYGGSGCIETPKYDSKVEELPESDVWEPPLDRYIKCNEDKLKAVTWKEVAEKYLDNFLSETQKQELINNGKYDALVTDAAGILQKANDGDESPYAKEWTYLHRAVNCGDGFFYYVGRILGTVPNAFAEIVDKDFNLYVRPRAIKELVDKYISPAVEPPIPPPPTPEIEVVNVATAPSEVRAGQSFTITLTGRNLDKAEHITLTNIKEPSFGIEKQEAQRIVFEKVTAIKAGEVMGRLWLSRADKEAGREPAGVFTIEIQPVIIDNRLKMAKSKLKSAIDGLKGVLTTAERDCPELVPTLENAVTAAEKNLRSNNLGKIKRHTELLNGRESRKGSIKYYKKEVKDCKKDMASADAAKKRAAELLAKSKRNYFSIIDQLRALNLTNCPDTLKGELAAYIASAQNLKEGADREAIEKKAKLVKGKIAYFKEKIKNECKVKEKPRCEGAAYSRIPAKKTPTCREIALKICDPKNEIAAKPNDAVCRKQVARENKTLEFIVNEWGKYNRGKLNEILKQYQTPSSY